MTLRGRPVGARLMGAVVLVGTLFAGIPSAGATEYVCEDSGENFPSVTAVERISDDVVGAGGDVETRVSIQGGVGPVDVYVNYIHGPNHYRTTDLFVTHGVVNVGNSTVVARGQAAYEIKLALYQIYVVAVIDSAGCGTFYYGNGSSNVERQPNPLPQAAETPTHSLDFSSQALTLGITPSRIADAQSMNHILSADDYSQTYADTLRLYRAFLDREPDVGGAKYWLQLTAQGVDLDTFAHSFAQSAEFAQRYGQLNNADFLTLLYQNMLGRTPDQAGYDYWLGLMNGGLSQHGTARWVVANQEFINLYPFAKLDPANPGDVVDCDYFATASEAGAWYSRYNPLYGDVADLRSNQFPYYVCPDLP